LQILAIVKVIVIQAPFFKFHMARQKRQGKKIRKKSATTPSSGQFLELLSKNFSLIWLP
jgi:hypothetical protein